jgi:hypothetical protein
MQHRHSLLMSKFVSPIRLMVEQGEQIPNPCKEERMRLHRISMMFIFLAMVPALWAANADVAAFDHLKALAGDWEGKTANGSKSHLRYEVVSNGSAVLERFENDQLGSGNTMVTVYYLDGDRLQLTHYCMAKNQPHMRAESFDSATGELRFAFVDATGLSGPEAGHMHNASFRFIDADHFTTDWQFFESGKPKFNESVQYTRVP